MYVCILLYRVLSGLVAVLFFLVFCGNGDAYRDSSMQGKQLLVKYISSPFDYYFETEFY